MNNLLRFLACIMAAQLSGSWVGGQALAMSLHRAPFHKGTQLPVAWGHPVWRTLAGYPNSSGTNDGPGISARFASVSGLAVNAAGEIYVADSWNGLIRKISPAGIVSTVAGTAGELGWRDGPATNALFNNPGALALDQDGSLYVADSYVIRKLSAAGLVTTIAGQPGVSGYRDGTGTNALFGYNISAIAVDTSGNLYVADGDNYVIRKISPDAVVSTLAGQPNNSGYRDGLGTNALFASYMGGLAFDTMGDLYLAESGNNVIRKISPAGLVTTWAGGPDRWGYRDDQGTNAWFASLSGLAIDSQGNVFVTETDNRCVRKISPDGWVSTLGGDAWVSAAPLHRDGRGPFANFDRPQAIAVDSSGHLLVGDSSAVRYGSLGPEAQPAILTQPRSQTVPAGADATLSVVVQGTASLTYQWVVNGEVLPGATYASLLLTNSQDSDAGEYRVALSDGLGYVLSFPATVQVQLAERASNAPLDIWRPIASAPLQEIHGLAHGNGLYVGIGGGYEWLWAPPSPAKGAVAVSTDGERWVKQLPITSESLNDIAFGNGLFVAVGNNGTVLTSTNGQAWAAQTLTPEGRPNLRGIAFDHGIFVAVSGDANGSIWTSPDGSQWTNRGMDFGVSFTAVKANSGRFIAAGNTIMVSTNGLDWEPADVPTNWIGQEFVFEHIGGANGTLLAAQHWGGFLAASAEGREWRDVTPTNDLWLSRVAAGNGQFVAVDSNSGGVSASTDGVTWTTPAVINSGGRTVSQPHLCFENGLFVASEYEGGLFTSSDGNSWVLHQQQQAIPYTPSVLIRAEGQYFASGGQGLESSTNGSDWNLLLPSNYISCLAYGKGTLVAVADGETIFSSPDGGATWTDRSPHLNYGTKTPSLSRMACGEGLFVAVGILRDANGSDGGHILCSSNLVNWQATNFSPASSLSDVAYGNGLFVALLNWSSKADILTSTNGISWKTAATFPSASLHPIAYGEGKFVVGNNSQAGVITSSDGVTWNQHLGPDVPGYVSAIVFGNGVFLASAGGSLWSSTDGVVWTQCATPSSTGYFQTIGAGEGAFFACGDDMILLQSGPFERLGNLRWLPNLDVEGAVTGAPFINYRIEFSEDLLNWQSLTRVTNAPATYPFTDPGAAARPSRFYRVVTE